MADREHIDPRKEGLKPLEAIDLSAARSFGDLLRQMSRTAFSGRQLGEAYDILVEVATTEECLLVLTMSGALSIAKQSGIIAELIERRIVKCVVSTGAIITHNCVEALGMAHFRHDGADRDDVLYRKGLNRVFDSLEPEANLLRLEAFIAETFRPDSRSNEALSSSSFCAALGRRFDELGAPSILASAYRAGVPVFIPAFTDCEIGLSYALSANPPGSTASAGKEGIGGILEHVRNYNPFIDLHDYCHLLAGQDALGILTLGGGVPRNWAQQGVLYWQSLTERLGIDASAPRFRYGVRICPEPAMWGGLSGCTYAEGVSWGKFRSPSQGGRFAEVCADATLAFPILAKALFEQIDSRS